MPGLLGSTVRSESTENETARRQLAGNQPVSIMGDMIGRMSPEAGANNEMREAMRMKIIQALMQTGGPALDNYGAAQTYGSYYGSSADPNAPMSFLQRITTPYPNR